MFALKTLCLVLALTTPNLQVEEGTTANHPDHSLASSLWKNIDGQHSRLAQVADTVDARQAALVEYSAEVTRNIVAAATGQPTDPRFNEVSGGGDGLNTTEAETVASVQALGGPVEVVLTGMELEAIAQGGPSGPVQLRTTVAVYPDGRVYLMEASVRQGEEEVFSQGHPELRELAPPLAGAIDMLLESLRGTGCNFPLLAEQDLSALPEDVREDVDTDRQELLELCGQLSALDLAWQPKVDDVSVLIRVGSSMALLRSGFELNDGHLSLNRVRFRSLD